MAILSRDNKQLIYIFSNDSILGKKLMPYLETSEKRVRKININKESVSDTIWIEIAGILNTPLGELFSLDVLHNTNINADASRFTSGDWLKLVNKNPSILQRPIAINGAEAKIISSKKDLDVFFNIEGERFDKSPKKIKENNHYNNTQFKNVI